MKTLESKYYVFLEQGTQEPSDGYTNDHERDATTLAHAKAIGREWLTTGEYRAASIHSKSTGKVWFNFEGEFRGWGDD